MPKLVRVKRPIPMRFLMRAGQIIDIEDWKFGDAFVRKGNLIELSEQESDDYLENVTPEELRKIRVVSDSSTLDQGKVTYNDDAEKDEKSIGSDESNLDSNSELGAKTAANPIEKIGVNPKIEAATVTGGAKSPAAKPAAKPKAKK